MLVLDANVARAACGGDDDADGFAVFGDELVSVPLMWSEARASLHLAVFKGKIGREDGEVLHERLENCPVDRIEPRNLGNQAWRLAEEFGWGRTYDAEYVALAKLLDCAWSPWTLA